MKKSKKTVVPATCGHSPETSKISWKVRVTDRLLRQIKTLSKPDRRRIGEAIRAVQFAWGQPHLHSGAGIRKLRKDLFECRSDLDTRILFLVVTAPGELVFFAMGNHDEVRSLLKTA